MNSIAEHLENSLRDLLTTILMPQIYFMTSTTYDLSILTFFGMKLTIASKEASHDQFKIEKYDFSLKSIPLHCVLLSFLGRYSVTPKNRPIDIICSRESQCEVYTKHANEETETEQNKPDRYISQDPR